MDVTVKRRRPRRMKPTRTHGKNVLWRNPEDPAFGRSEQTGRHAINRRHPQSLVSKLKLPGQLRIIGPRKKAVLRLQCRIAKPKPSRPCRRNNLKRDRQVPLAEL